MNQVKVIEIRVKEKVIKNINKLVSNFTSRLPPGRVQPIFQNCQQNIIEIKLTSPSNLKYKDKKNSDYKEENKKWRKSLQRAYLI